MAFRSSSPVPTAGPGHSFSVMTVLSEVNLAVCDSLFSLFSQSSVLYLASDIQKIAPAFAELTLRPKSSALTTPERNIFFLPFQGKALDFLLSAASQCKITSGHREEVVLLRSCLASNRQSPASNCLYGSSSSAGIHASRAPE